MMTAAAAENKPDLEIVSERIENSVKFPHKLA